MVLENITNNGNPTKELNSHGFFDIYFLQKCSLSTDLSVNVGDNLSNLLFWKFRHAGTFFLG